MPELIYKQDALRLCKDADWKDDECFIVGYNFAMREMAESIEELPKIEAKPVQHGRWVLNSDENFVCSQCRHPQQIGAKDFCGKCGADMRVEGANNGD